MYSESLLLNFIGMHNALIKMLVAHCLNNFKVMDCCCRTDCPPTAILPDRIAVLRKVSARDGVHYAGDGYKHLANRCLDCLKTLLVLPTKAPQLTSF
jgi:hypothetical protein